MYAPRPSATTSRIRNDRPRRACLAPLPVPPGTRYRTAAAGSRRRKSARPTARPASFRRAGPLDRAAGWRSDLPAARASSTMFRNRSPLPQCRTQRLVAKSLSPNDDQPRFGLRAVRGRRSGRCRGRGSRSRRGRHGGANRERPGLVALVEVLLGTSRLVQSLDVGFCPALRVRSPRTSARTCRPCRLRRRSPSAPAGTPMMTRKSSVIGCGRRHADRHRCVGADELAHALASTMRSLSTWMPHDFASAMRLVWLHRPALVRRVDHQHAACRRSSGTSLTRSASCGSKVRRSGPAITAPWRRRESCRPAPASAWPTSKLSSERRSPRP